MTPAEPRDDGYRPEFRQALELIGRACAEMKRQGRSLPVLVGGAVVEWYSASAYMSGDFDLQVLTPEDIVADRIGQYSANPHHGRELLAQARLVYQLLAPQIDRDYLNKRLPQQKAAPRDCE